MPTGCQGRHPGDVHLPKYRLYMFPEKEDKVVTFAPEVEWRFKNFWEM
jgi:hypothetical protein